MTKKVLFGCGTFLNLYLDLCGLAHKQGIKAIYDNTPKCEKVDGIDVLHARELAGSAFDFDEIIITSRHYIDIYNQLVTLGCPESKITVFHALLSW